MLLGSNERTLDRKVKEAILAMRVEHERCRRSASSNCI